MKKLLTLAVFCIGGYTASAQIPASLQGKYRGFNQQGNKVDITTTVLIQSDQILLTFNGREMAFDMRRHGKLASIR